MVFLTGRKAVSSPEIDAVAILETNSGWFGLGWTPPGYHKHFLKSEPLNTESKATTVCNSHFLHIQLRWVFTVTWSPNVGDSARHKLPRAVSHSGPFLPVASTQPRLCTHHLDVGLSPAAPIYSLVFLHQSLWVMKPFQSRVAMGHGSG